jgi:hypothetical protein
MAKKKTTKRVKTTKKPAVVIRITQSDCDQILKALKHLDPRTRKGKRVSAATLIEETQRAVAQPTVYKLIKQMHDYCCMSCPPDGKLIVIDIEEPEK